MLLEIDGKTKEKLTTEPNDPEELEQQARKFLHDRLNINKKEDMNLQL